MILHKNLYRRIHGQLIWIDIDDKDSRDMIHHDLDSKGTPIGKERIIIPTFDLYSREVDDSNGKDRLVTFVYEIKCTPKTDYMLKIYFIKYLQKILTSSLFPID